MNFLKHTQLCVNVSVNSIAKANHKWSIDRNIKLKKIVWIECKMYNFFFFHIGLLPITPMKDLSVPGTIYFKPPKYLKSKTHSWKVNDFLENKGHLVWYFPTWSHKNTCLCALSVRYRFMYLKAHFTAVSKRNVHRVALKHRLNTWTLARFYYVDIGTYCCVFITLLQNCIVAVQNSNICT